MIQSTGVVKKYFYSHAFKWVSFFLLALLILFWSSCKKKENKESIEITILQPLDGFSAHFKDTVRIVAEIQSSSIITDVSVMIADENNFPVSGMLNISVQSAHVFIDTFYVPDNDFAPSGNYNVFVTATDGEIIKWNTREIYLEAEPKILEDVFLITGNNNLSYSIYKKDSMSLAMLQNVSGDFLNASISSRYRQLYVCGSNTGSLNYFAIDSFHSFFSIYSTFPPNPPNFTAFYFANELNFVGFYDGSIIGYDKTGFREFGTAVNPYFTIGAILKSGSYLIAEQNSTSVLTQKKLIAYFYPSGNPRQSLDIDFDVISIQELSADEKLIFAEKDNRLLIYKYSIQNNNVNLIKDAGLLKLFNVTKLTSTQYLLSTQQGVYHYLHYNGSNLNVAGFPCYNIEYDDVNNQYYCLSGSEVYVLNAGTFSQSALISLPDSVVSVKLLYNR